MLRSLLGLPPEKAKSDPDPLRLALAVVLRDPGIRIVRTGDLPGLYHERTHDMVIADSQSDKHIAEMFIRMAEILKGR